jgi:hypothetical protein
MHAGAPTMHCLALDRRQLLASAAGAAVAANLPAIAWSRPAHREVEARLVRLLDESRALLLIDGRHITLGRGEAYEGWTLVELVGDLDPMVALENFAELDGKILLVGLDGIQASFGKTAESTAQDIPRPYFGHDWAEVTESPTDLLGRDVLGRPGDPDYARVASAFPPIRQLWGDTYSFLGTPQTMDKVWFLYGGRSPNFDPAIFYPPIEQIRKDGKVFDGLAGGHLPVLRFVYPETDGYTEMLAFAPFRIVDGNLRVQPVWYRVAHVVAGKLEWIRYVDSYLPYPPRTDADPRAFYRDLLGLKRGWNEILRESITLEIPDQRVADMARHSLIRSIMGRSAGFPKYGVVNKNYGGTEHDGFPDTFTVDTEAMVEWGLNQRAAAYIDNYLTHFVRDDGTILYRGPETGQFGRMLTVCAMYADRSGDDALLLRHAPRIDAIANILLGMRKKALGLDPADPAYGMISGWSEADAVLESDPQRYMQPYFSNSCEAARGFRDLGRVWQRAGDAALRGRGVMLDNESRALLRDLDQAMKRSMLVVDGETILPPIAGAKEPFHIVLQSDRTDPQWRSYRSWMEMLHSGLLDDERIGQVVDYRERHHDIILGVPMAYGYRTYEMAGFLSYGHGYGLIQADRIRDALLMTYSIMAHQYTRGMWLAPETRRLAKGESASAYCSPAELSMPLVTRWLLAFEDPRDDLLWLAKGMPRQWLAAGTTIAIDRIPTRWGRVGYRLEPRGSAIHATLDLPDRGIPSVRLRLRHPNERRLRAVTIDGRSILAGSFDADTVTLPPMAKGRVEIVARFA